VRPSDQRDEDDRKKRPADDEDPRRIAVGEITDARLDNKGEHPHHSGDQADLGQRQRKFVREDRKERADERAIEIAREVDQGEGEDHFDIGLVSHGHFKSLEGYRDS